MKLRLSFLVLTWKRVAISQWLGLRWFKTGRHHLAIKFCVNWNWFVYDLDVVVQILLL